MNKEKKEAILNDKYFQETAEKIQMLEKAYDYLYYFEDGDFYEDIKYDLTANDFLNDIINKAIVSIIDKLNGVGS